MENAITILHNLIYHRFFHFSNTTGATSGAGTAFHSEAPDLTTGFTGALVADSLVFCVVFCLVFLRHYIVYPY
jgi:hypothetical protein